MSRRARALLWFDGGAAFAGGTTVLALREWFAELHRFPVGLVLFIGIANLLYASYSGSLAALASLQKTPSRRAIEVLVVGNLLWMAFCAAVLVATWSSASGFGSAHVGLEGLFVGLLAAAEYRFVRPFGR